MARNQIKSIKEKAKALPGEKMCPYLAGVRDGMDLAVLIADDNKWPLAKSKTLQEFLDWLDAQKM